MIKPHQTLLLAVTGNSPQIVTETLYGIFQQQLEWPNRIVIITTQIGAATAKRTLIDEGKLAALCTEWDLPLPAFSEQDLLVITGAEDKPVDDARTEEDQTALADFITRHVAQFTSDTHTRVHASIAGGRKTMTFFLGYAMTVFGRDFDRLSHVLVSEQFESLADFYYPSRNSHLITNRNGEYLDTANAEIMLAEIPFVSQRSMLGEANIRHFASLGYSELVRQIRLANRPNDIKLHFEFDVTAPSVMVNDLRLDFSKHRLEFAFYAMFARPRDEYEDPIERPSDATNITLVTKALSYELTLLMRPNAHAHKEEPKFWEEMEDLAVIDSRTRIAILENPHTIGITEKQFDARKNSLYKFLKQHVPQALADILMPSSSGKSKQYRMNLPPEQISFSVG
ncbi:CRISPR-associated ring nuclease Csm6 [Shewanella xiamenensis]|uniref:CRISPR-associated ring nuclease Csm6 n=1 Tax=Shewanella xiamenensis TaxID=332186 RepID=UPI002E7BFB6A|nr:CRISPR-associated ring nuclease Csm6 [Shewanella xiamenensis]